MQSHRIAIGETARIVAAHSEVCMHMRVAGTTMDVRLEYARRMNGELSPYVMAQLLNDNGSNFSAPILPGEAGILEDRDGYYAPSAVAMTVADKTAALMSAGFPVRYVDWDDAEPSTYIAWHDPQDSPDGMSNPEPWVDLGSVARGEDGAGQSSTVDRSNYRSLERDYPDTWLPLSYSNVDTLGALVRDLSDDLVGILTGLREQYPLYDESDLSELESEEITESYGQWARDDIRAELPEHAREAWDDLTSEKDRDLVWSVVTDLELYPEHDSLDVHWDVAKIAAEVANRLESAS